MNLTIIKLSANDQVLAPVLQPKIASGNINSIKLQVAFSDEWDGFTERTGTFYTSVDETVYEAPMTDDKCIIPHEVLAESGFLFIGVRGVNSSENAEKTTAVIKYKIEVGAPSGGSASSPVTPGVPSVAIAPADWSQNDPNGAGYVNNRTHHKEVSGVDIVAFPETTVELTSGNTMVNGFVENSFIEGNKYKVIWNGAEYECICYVEDGTYLLGNGVYLGLTTEKDYPFCIGSYNGAVGFVGKGTETNETITLKIYSEQETIYHQLDPRYIPDMYYEEDGGTVEILPEMTIPVDPDNPTIPSNYEFDIAAGDILTVKWNGVEYVCTVQDVSGAIGMPGVALGDLTSAGLSGNGEPFMMVYSPELMEAQGMSGFYGMIGVLDGSTSVTLSIVKGSAKIHKIDNKYLNLEWIPETKTVKGDEIVSEVTLPISDSLVNGYKHQIEGTENLFVAGATYIVNWRGKEYTTKGIDTAQYGADWGVVIGNLGGYILSQGVTDSPIAPTDEPFYIQDAGTTNIGGVTYRNIHMFTLDGQTGDLTVSIHEVTKQVNKIPEKFLPDGLQNKGIPTYTGDTNPALNGELQEVTAYYGAFFKENLRAEKLKLYIGIRFSADEFGIDNSVDSLGTSGSYVFDFASEGSGCLYYTHVGHFMPLDSRTEVSNKAVILTLIYDTNTNTVKGIAKLI